MTRQVPSALHINWTRCDGRGLCAELLAGLLSRDEWGYPVGPGGSNVPLAPQWQEAAAEAVDLCPRQALQLLFREQDTH